MDKFSGSRFRGPPGTNTILDVLRAGTRKGRDISKGLVGETSATGMLDPNAFYATPTDPTRLGILAQLRAEGPEKDWNEY